MTKTFALAATTIAATLVFAAPTFAQTRHTHKHNERHYRAMVTEPAPAYAPSATQTLSPREFDPQRAYHGRDQTLDFNNHYY
ncbi:MAG TPA: hypothetical protein VGU72_10185 [Beijerinckiaceae bacterium]|jgi:hypothetical protein|nr:hypothetical protein [Beijerinckiaceae bacterium]